MSQRTFRQILFLFVLSPVVATTALAQTPADSETLASGVSNTWQSAESAALLKCKLFVVTLDQPNRRQTCRIQSFTVEKLVCSRVIGASRTYLWQQILALILPGDGDLKVRFLLGFNLGLGAAIWGTVVLAATCLACAVATGIAAFFCLGASGTVMIADDQPDRLLYLAPGQQLSGKLGFVQS